MLTKGACWKERGGRREEVARERGKEKGGDERMRGREGGREKKREGEGDSGTDRDMK